MKKPEYAKDHKPFLSGVRGGFSCSRCEYLRPDHHCANEFYQKYYGTSKLPEGDLEEMCSDWFEQRKGRKSVGDELKDQRKRK